MAERNNPPDSRGRPRLAVPQADAASQLRAQIEKGKQLGLLSTETGEELLIAEGKFKRWDDFNKTLLKRVFQSDEISEEYAESAGGIYAVLDAPLDVEVRQYKQAVDRSVVALESIEDRLELWDEVKAEYAPGPEPVSGVDVFIVHGHDKGAKACLARSIRGLGLNPIILHEKPNRGRTVIEKLEDEASPAGYAVILLTADDVGASKEKPKQMKPRARQNVMLELGFFVGKLGRDKVCVLHKNDVEIPSDILGVIYVPMDPSGAWEKTLARELNSAGLEFDASKLLDD